MTPFRLHRYSVSFANRVPLTASCIVCAGVFVQHHPASAPASASHQCSLEATQAAVKHQQRRRPPEFGSSVPTITGRRISTTKQSSSKIALIDNRHRDDCPMCKKFSKGPCGRLFTEWLACTDANPGNDDRGEPLHLTRCSDFAEKLAECLEENVEYYSKNDNDDMPEGNDSAASEDALKDEWKEFVREMEDAIKSGKYLLLPFPHNLQPKMEVRLSTHTGAAFFVPDNDGQPILAAYILDDTSSNVIAAASREDMYLNTHLGCVIQFKIVEGMKSATCRAVYDSPEEEDVVVYTRSVMVPVDATKG